MQQWRASYPLSGHGRGRNTAPEDSGDGLKAVLAIAVQGRTVDVVAEGPVMGTSLWSDIWKHQIPLASPPMASLG